MRTLTFAGSLVVALLASTAAPALANTPLTDNTMSRMGSAQARVADESSPAGMQERSRRSYDDRDEVAPDEDGDSADQTDRDDDLSRDTFANRDFGPPDSDEGPDDRGYRGDSDSSVDGSGPPDGYEDGDRGGQSDEDDDDDDNDDDSGIHQA